MSETFASLVSKCDALIKAGKIGEVAGIFSALNLSQVPRKFRQPLAKICRRSGLIEKGLRLLFPVIRNEKELEEAPTESEIAEYSVLLSRNGSIREALDLLEQVDADSLPEALLYRGFCHVSSWDYAQAAQLFERFLTGDVDDYSKLIARVNLASSYLAINNLEAAKLLLTQTIELAREAKATRLIGNLYELRGQAHVLEGSFAYARQDLNRALAIFGEGRSYDQLLILKWQSVIQAVEEKSTRALQSFRQEAWTRKHWESVREADLFSLKIAFDQRAFDHLTIGTAAPKYRDRILEILGHTPSPKYALGEPLSLVRLNLSTGTVSTKSELNPGKKIHQALVALTRDFYFPRNMGTLFAELYPDEYFNVDSSPTRVRQILNRTRRWFEENAIPARIAISSGGYRLSIDGSFALEVPLRLDAATSPSLRWSELKSKFEGRRAFSVREALDTLSISSSAFHRLIQWARDNQQVEVSGAGKATRYSISKRAA